MTHLKFKYNVISKSNFTQIASIRDDGCTGRECRSGEYGLKSSTKTGVVLQIAEGSERKVDKQSIGYYRRFIYGCVRLNEG
jgi:hypothetical protein